MLVAIMLNVFYEHMLRIPKRPFLGLDRNMRVVDSMLLVDEADNIMKYEFDVLRRDLVAGSRIRHRSHSCFPVLEPL